MYREYTIIDHNGFEVHSDNSGHLQSGKNLTNHLSMSYNEENKIGYILSKNKLIQIGLKNSKRKSFIIPVFIKKETEQFFSIQDYETGTYIASPFSSGHPVFLEGGREAPKDWEMFILKNIKEETEEKIYREFDTILNKPTDLDYIINTINSFDKENLLKLLDFLKSYIPDKVFLEIIRNAIYSEGIFSKIESLAQEDIWIRHFFPYVRNFLHNEFEDYPARKIEFDGNSIKDFLPRIMNGEYISFGHKTISALKKYITPKKKICIVTSCRDEGIYLLEWISFYKSIGVDHFFIYSNSNQDGSDFLLDRLVEIGVITLIKSEVPVGVSAQYQAFSHALNFLPDIYNYEWVAIFDLDEFLYVSEKFDFNLKRFLNWIAIEEVDAIAINWRSVSSSHHSPRKKENSLLIERNQFIHHKEFLGDGSKLVKSIFRPHLFETSYAHDPVSHSRSTVKYLLTNGTQHRYKLNPPGFHDSPAISDTTTYVNAILFHYMHKSAEEWLWKRSKNGGNTPFNKNQNLKFFVENYLWEFVNESRQGRLLFPENITPLIKKTKTTMKEMLLDSSLNDRNNNVKKIYEEKINILFDELQNEYHENMIEFLSLLEKNFL